MRKKYLVLLGAVLIGLAFHACSLPDSINFPEKIKVKGTLDYDLLLNATNIDLGRIFIDMIRAQLAEIDSDQFTIDVWEADYGQKELTFLLKLTTTLTNSLNPGTYLNGAGFHLEEISPDPFDIEYSIDTPSIEIKRTVEVTFTSLGNEGAVVTIPADFPSIEIPDTTFDENDIGFLHALIDEVDFKIDFTGDTGGLTDDDLEFTFNASQATDGSYTGLTGSSLSPGDLEGKPINRKALSFSKGEIKIKPGTVLKIPQTKTINLTVTMNIKKLKNVKWDFTKVSGQFQDEALAFPPYSLAEPAKYVKELDFDECNGTGDQGIGLKAHFEKVIPGLRLNIKCEDIEVDATKDLVEDDIVFGNTDGLLYFKLEKYKNNANYLLYELALASANDTNKDILEIPELTPGEPLEIKGKVEFFHWWTRAILDMKEIIIFANVKDDDFKGEVPDVFDEEKPEDPIDLSMLKDYIDGGVTFDRMKTDIYLSGPKGAIEKLVLPNLEFSAGRVPPSGEPLGEPIGGEPLYNGPLILGYPVEIELENGYYKSGNLPLGGMEIENAPFTKLMEILLKEAPDNLFFQYNVTMDEELTVTYDMFKEVTDAIDDENDDVLIVDVLVLLPLNLRVIDEGLRFPFKKYIGEQKDIFGREKPGEDAGFPDMKMPTLNISLDFQEQIFSGGTIFLFTDRVRVKKEEGEGDDNDDERGVDLLFPNGIPLKGRSMSINVSGAALDRVLSSTAPGLLVLEPFVEFAPGDMVTIPKNMGLMGIKLGIKDYSVDVDISGLW
jgi:hypothetical protein